MKFEVGKKYRYGKNMPVAECLFVDSEVLVLRYLDNRHVYSQSIAGVSMWWEEYHEPKVIKDTLYVHGMPDWDGVQVSTHGYYAGGVPVMGRIGVTLTDGKLTNVEILK